MLGLPPPQQLGPAEFDTLINGAIKRSIQALSKLAGFASDDTCIPKQYLRMVSVMYYQLAATKIPRGVAEEDYSLNELEIPFASLASLGATLPVWITHIELCPKLVKGLQDHWPDIRQWILYLYRKIIIKDNIAMIVRCTCKSAVLEFLGLIRDRLLMPWSKLIPADREIMRVICNLWFMETREPSFSSWSETMNTQRESAVLNSTFLIAYEARVAIDWGNLLSICRDDAEAMASIALCHLDHELSHDVLDLHCIAWDLHIITTFSSRENIRLALLHQGTIKVAADILSLVVSKTWEGDMRVVACRCMVNAITLLGLRIEDMDAIPYIIEALEHGLIASLLQCEELLQFADQVVAGHQPVRLLGDVLPGYTVYRSVLRVIALSVGQAEESRLDMHLAKGGELYKAWFRLKDAVHQRRQLLKHDIADVHIQTCQNDKCSKAGEVGAFKRCAGCLHSYYCSKKCQRDDWRSGRHKTYCNMVHRRFTRTKGQMSSVHTKDLKFLDEVILAELRKHKERISIHKLNINVIELNFVGGAVDIVFDSRRLNPNPFGVKCLCENLSAMRWRKILDGSKEAEEPFVFVRAFIPGGMTRKIVLQAIPLSRILGEENKDSRRRKRLEPYLFNLMFSCCGKDSINKEPRFKGRDG